MLINNIPIYNAIIIYVIFILILYILKPKFFFNEENQFKSFGINEGETLFTFSSIVIGGAIIIYTICLCLWLSK